MEDTSSEADQKPIGEDEIENNEDLPSLEDGAQNVPPPTGSEGRIESSRHFFGAIPEAEMNNLPSDLQSFIRHLQQHVEQHLTNSNIQTQSVSASQSLSEDENVNQELPDPPLNSSPQDELRTDSEQTTPMETESQNETQPLLSESTAQEQQPSDQTQPSNPRVRTMLRFVIFYETTPPNSNPSDSTTTPNAEANSSDSMQLDSAAFPAPASPGALRQLVLNLILSHNDVESGDFHDVMNRLFLMHESHGPPPTSKKALESLHQTEITEEILGMESTCTVCFEEFEESSFATTLPCKHIFHKDCVHKWLLERNTCPVCRYELPTEDEDYEKLRLNRMKERNVDEEAYFKESETI